MCDIHRQTHGYSFIECRTLNPHFLHATVCGMHIYTHTHSWYIETHIHMSTVICRRYACTHTHSFVGQMVTDAMNLETDAMRLELDAMNLCVHVHSLNVCV